MASNLRPKLERRCIQNIAIGFEIFKEGAVLHRGIETEKLELAGGKFTSWLDQDFVRNVKSAQGGCTITIWRWSLKVTYVGFCA